MKYLLLGVGTLLILMGIGYGPIGLISPSIGRQGENIEAFGEMIRGSQEALARAPALPDNVHAASSEERTLRVLEAKLVEARENRAGMIIWTSVLIGLGLLAIGGSVVVGRRRAR
jgi:hypothetical protein